VNAENVAVWDRLYRHLGFLTHRGIMSADELADIFARLLISCDSELYNSRCVDQVCTSVINVALHFLLYADFKLQYYGQLISCLLFVWNHL